MQNVAILPKLMCTNYLSDILHIIIFTPYVQIYINFMHFFSGIQEQNLRLQHLLRFVTGCYSLPPLGLPDSIKIKFLHGCHNECKCRPIVSTCQLFIRLPVHAATFQEMKELMVSALLEGFGFGNI